MGINKLKAEKIITINDKEYTVKLTAREIRTLDKKGIILG